jgi:hypothetical protein
MDALGLVLLKERLVDEVVGFVSGLGVEALGVGLKSFSRLFFLFFFMTFGICGHAQKVQGKPFKLSRLLSRILKLLVVSLEWDFGLGATMVFEPVACNSFFAIH